MVNMLHAWQGPTCVRRLFMTFPMAVLDGDDITAMGKVTAVREVDGEMLADCDIWLHRANGDRPLSGRATVLLSQPKAAG